MFLAEKQHIVPGIPGVPGVPGVPDHTWRSRGSILEILGRFIQDFIQKLRSFDISTQAYYDVNMVLLFEMFEPRNSGLKHEKNMIDMCS